MAEIEDYEVERNGRYMRVSIDDLTEEEAEVIMTFMNYVVKEKKVPKLSNKFVKQE